MWISGLYIYNKCVTRNAPSPHLSQMKFFDYLGNNPRPSPVYPCDLRPESIMQETQSEHFIEANRFAK